MKATLLPDVTDNLMPHHSRRDFQRIRISVEIPGCNEDHYGADERVQYGIAFLLVMMMGRSPGCHGGYFCMTALKYTEPKIFFSQPRNEA
jgi:hypothetical protein